MKKDELEEKIRQDQLDLHRDYKTIFSSVAGKRVLYDLMDRGYILKPTANDTKGNPIFINMNEGKRELILHILSVLKYNPKKLKELLDNSDESEGDHI